MGDEPLFPRLTCEEALPALPAVSADSSALSNWEFEVLEADALPLLLAAEADKLANKADSRLLTELILMV